MTPELVASLERYVRLLINRVSELEARIQAGDDTAWSDLIEAVKALALVVSNLAPERRGALLTTSEMAARLGIAPKTLLRHKARGHIRPALQRGKLIRWRSDEVGR